MSKVKVINLNFYVAEASKSEYKSHGEHTLAIIEGPKGTIIVSTDATHTFDDAINPADIDIQLPVVKNTEVIQVFPEGMGQVTLHELLTHDSTVEMNLKDFIELFGNRIRANVKLLKDSIKDAGLNPDDYNI
jgi:hypothetical protein